MKLLIISHTEHYRSGNTIVGWNPTVREIDQLATLFETITHLAPLHQLEAPPSAVAYAASNIYFQPLAPSGGQGLYNKLKILWYAIPNLIKINRECKKADFIHFRAPTNLGVYTLPFLWFYRHKKQWIKYAGNWVQQNKPWSYRFQKWWMAQNFNQAVVSINGAWTKQPAHIKTFENPCLTEVEYSMAKSTEKNWSGKLILCFAGALNPKKGAYKIMEALNSIPHIEQHIEKIIFAGDGEEKEKLLKSKCKVPMEILGFLSKDHLFHEFAQAHGIILPSENEGFPKVIAEAMAFGCIPIVTDVSSIGQYINDSNGLLLKNNEVEEIAVKIELLTKMQDSTLHSISEKAKQIPALFTFENYLRKIKIILEF